MGIKNKRGLIGVDTTNMQILQNQTDGTVTNVLYMGNVYSTSAMNSELLHDFLIDLSNGIVNAEPCKRLNPQVTQWLTAIGELENVLARKEEVKKELRKEKLQEHMAKKFNGNGSDVDYKERMEARIEAGKDVLKNEVFDFGIEYRMPARIVKDHLNDLQYRLEYVYDKRKDDYEYKLVKSDKKVFIPLDKVLAWYYTNYDMTSREYLESIDGIKDKEYPTMTYIAWKNLFEVDGKMTSYKVLKMVVQAWVKYYEINKEVTDNELQKIVKYLKAVGV